MHNLLLAKCITIGCTESPKSPAPCRRIFLSKRRPRADKHLHCSLKCSRLAATHRYRERQREELRSKEQGKKLPYNRYAAKLRLKLGAKTKVERRPRARTYK